MQSTGTPHARFNPAVVQALEKGGLPDAGKPDLAYWYFGTLATFGKVKVNLSATLAALLPENATF